MFSRFWGWLSPHGVSLHVIGVTFSVMLFEEKSQDRQTFSSRPPQGESNMCLDFCIFYDVFFSPFPIFRGISHQ